MSETPQVTQEEQFRLACGAFDLFTWTEKWQVLVVFASLRYPSVPDRFFEAVHRVVKDIQAGER